jgi:gliding motility-associated-like protein
MNRWGKVVYQSLDQAEGWDGSHQGQPCADGVYYYILTYSGKYGSQTTGRNIKQGGVTLMR